MSRPRKPRLNPSSLLRYDEGEEGPTPDRDTPADSPSDPSSRSLSSEQIDSQQLRDEDTDSSGEEREERLARIRAAIEAGIYETPDKLEAALGRLLEALEQEEDDEPECKSP